MTLAAGTMVTSNVRLVELIAEGGMASVWLADHLGLDMPVAVKFISPEVAEKDPSVETRFKREASLTAKLRSVHVVQTFDHGAMPDGTLYIVMEYLEGSLLADWMALTAVMGLREEALIVSQVAKVLQRCHGLGVIHRDIKPENIFLVDADYDVFIKVLDFGIAKEVGLPDEPDDEPPVSITRTGVVVGTPEYMSPEQTSNSGKIDEKSDLWSLAVVAYELLTGRRPYREDDDDKEPMWIRMSNSKFPPASSINPDLPEAIDAWFKTALNPRPSERHASAREMASKFTTIVIEHGTRVGGPLSTARKPAARRAMVAEDIDPEERIKTLLRAPVDEAAGAIPEGRAPTLRRIPSVGGSVVISPRAQLDSESEDTVEMLEQQPVLPMRLGGGAPLPGRPGPARRRPPSARQVNPRKAKTLRVSLKQEDKERFAPVLPAAGDEAPVPRTPSAPRPRDDSWNFPGGAPFKAETLLQGRQPAAPTQTSSAHTAYPPRPGRGTSYVVAGVVAGFAAMVLGLLLLDPFAEDTTATTASASATSSPAARPSGPIDAQTAPPPTATASGSAEVREERATPMPLGWAQVTISAAGGKCKVAVNAVDRGPTPLHRARVPSGRINVVCKPPVGRPRMQTISLREGQHKHVAFDLRR
jgi:serine/threonine-protein kinase